MSVATGNITGAAILHIGEDTAAANIQTYGTPREMEITCLSNTVLQLRLDLDDYTDNGDWPVIGITLGYMAGTFTADAGTEEITTSADHLRAVDDEIVFYNTGGSLPAGLTAGPAQTYYVLTVPAANKVTVSEERGGSTVNITTTGSGTHSFKAYGTSGGVDVTNDAYMGGGGEPAFPVLTLKDQRSGGRDDFEKVKALQIVAFPTDGTAAASGFVIVKGGDLSDPRSYFVVPLELDSDANSGHSAFATFALPVGWNYSDANKITVTIHASDNLSVLLNLLGN